MPLFYLTKDPSAGLPNDWRLLGGGPGGPGVPGTPALTAIVRSAVHASIPPGGGGFLFPIINWSLTNQLDAAELRLDCLLTLSPPAPIDVKIALIINGVRLKDSDGFEFNLDRTAVAGHDNLSMTWIVRYDAGPARFLAVLAALTAFADWGSGHSTSPFKKTGGEFETPSPGVDVPIHLEVISSDAVDLILVGGTANLYYPPSNLVDIT